MLRKLRWAPIPSRSLEQRPGQPRLPDNRHQRSHAEFPMVRHRHGRGVPTFGPLHQNVATSSPYLREPMRREYGADLSAR